MNNCVDLDKINSQLKRAEIQKSKLICNIYREYELYLRIVRDLLSSSVEKGINQICSYPPTKDNLLDANEFFGPFEKNISNQIYTYLPLLTVEQLKINIVEKNIQKEIKFNNLGIFKKANDYQKERFLSDYNFQLEESVQFQISEDISNRSEYYQAESNEKFVSIDLDNNDHSNFFSNNNIIENTGLEKQFISSLLELLEEVKNDKTSYSEKNKINQLDTSPKHQSLKIFDSIDMSLENLLLDFSYEINQELFKAKLIKKIISKDSFYYLVSKKLMLKHPYAFVIYFEFNENYLTTNSKKPLKIIFFNISTIELEFKNLNLSIQRNKINELKNQFQRLIKKETYWRQKEITLNRIR